MQVQPCVALTKKKHDMKVIYTPPQGGVQKSEDGGGCSLEEGCDPQSDA